MKKAARIIIPIVLILVILLGSAWYMFVYDRDFTRDMFLHSARFFHSEGNHKIASWCYDCAYTMSADNDSVAIELSQQHAEDGNYLQAEKALTAAISDSPSTTLYVALSKLYLEQDKVLDAVKLMDQICGDNSKIDSNIRNELKKLRPSAPVAKAVPNPEDPTLDKSVTFTTTNASLYINKSGTFPLYNDKTYRYGSTATIDFNEGMNDFYAVAISDDGIVSSLTRYEYELNSNHRRLTEVEFSDPVMESALRQLLNIDAEKVVMTEELWAITEFTVPEGVTNLHDLYHLIGLEKLTVSNAPAGELSYLADMKPMKELTITGTALTQEEVTAIGNLPNLEKLTLNKCGLTILNGLENAQRLTYLDLSGNSIVDISKISNLAGITELYLNENALSSLSGIANMHGLTKLNVANNVLTSVADMTGCYGLTALVISGNKLTHLNEITQMSSLSILDFSNNSVTSLPSWEKDCPLITIDGSYNNISSLEPLNGLQNLNNVYMDYNANIDSISCLKDCSRLVQVNVYGTKVKNVMTLTEMGIIVKYDPT